MSCPASRFRVPLPLFHRVRMAALTGVFGLTLLFASAVSAQFGPQLPPILELPPLALPPGLHPSVDGDGFDDPDPSRTEEENCATLKSVEKEGAEVVEAAFDVAFVSAARTADGRVMPFVQSDCDGDGDLDLRIGWSDFTAAPPVQIKLAEVCEGELPTSVTVAVLTDNASIHAYSRDGALLGSSTAGARYRRHELTVAHPSGIQWIELVGTQMCLLDICWSCADKEIPTDDPEGCTTLNAGYAFNDRPFEVRFGEAVVRAARTPDGRWIDLHVDDCDNDGNLDVWIPWSESDAAPAASIDLTNVCGGKLPTEVTLVLHTDVAVFHAYDAGGNLVASEGVRGPRERKELVLASPGGIARLEFEGFELCILALCWSCDDAVEVEVAAPAPRFVRGDTTGDGALDMADGLAVLGQLFQGGAKVTCKAAADVDDNDTIDLADAMTVFAHLFLGGKAPGAPYPKCGADPTGTSMDCEVYDSCPSS